MKEKWEEKRKRLFHIIEVGYDLDYVSRAYDFLNVGALILYLAASILSTYDNIQSSYGAILTIIEHITVVFFAIDYILRLITAKYLYPKLSERRAVFRYAFSFSGMVDLLSFLPDCLPIFFPQGTIAFRMIRIVRIFRLFRINAYYDSLSVITAVIRGKGQQLISSVFIILVLMLASSLCMYSLEHEAQPEVFSNAFSGIWWAASTLLTVGYGDIYPVTTLGKLFGIFISFLGVGMVAIPTGIISAGFVDQYTHLKRSVEVEREADMQFIKITIKKSDKWNEKCVRDLELPEGIILAAIKREEEILVPRGDIRVKEDDVLVLGAEPFDSDEYITLKEIELQKQNPWIGRPIQELNISRHSLIVMIKRGSKIIIPNGNTVLCIGDRVFLYTELCYAEEKDYEI